MSSIADPWDPSAGNMRQDILDAEQQDDLGGVHKWGGKRSVPQTGNAGKFDGGGGAVGFQAVGAGRGHPWSKQMGLEDFCSLKAGMGHGNLQVDSFCEALKMTGYEAAKIDKAQASFAGGRKSLEAFFCDLSEALNVVIELRIKDEEASRNEVLEFSNGRKMSYPGGTKRPSPDGALVVHLTLRYDGEKWEWDIPARRVAIDLLPAETSMSAHTGSQVMMGLRKHALFDHRILKEEKIGDMTLLKELPPLSERSVNPVEGDPLCVDGKPLAPDQAAALITQSYGSSGRFRTTCYVMSGLYGLLTSRCGARVLAERVQFNHPEPGRATISFPGFDTKVELAMVVPLDESGAQIYSNSDPRIELLVRAFDVLRQSNGASPVQLLGEPELVLRAFGQDTETIVAYTEMDTREAEEDAVLGDIKRTILDLVDRSQEKGLPLVMLWKEHVLAVKAVNEQRNELLLFDPRKQRDDTSDESLSVEEVARKIFDTLKMSQSEKTRTTEERRPPAPVRSIPVPVFVLGTAKGESSGAKGVVKSEITHVSMRSYDS